MTPGEVLHPGRNVHRASDDGELRQITTPHETGHTTSLVKTDPDGQGGKPLALEFVVVVCQGGSNRIVALLRVGRQATEKGDDAVPEEGGHVPP